MIALPILVAFTAKAYDDRRLTIRWVLIIVGLCCFFSKAWMVINVGPPAVQPLEFPLQLLFAGFGPWMTGESYVFHGAIVLVIALMLPLYWRLNTSGDGPPDDALDPHDAGNSETPPPSSMPSSDAPAASTSQGPTMTPCRPLLLAPDNTGPLSPAWLRYSFAAVSSLLILVCVMQLWRADLRVPFSYTGDALGMGSTVKGLIENHWYLYNPRVGMPTGLHYYDYPVPEVLHLSSLKVISVFSHSYATVLDVYFVLSVLIGTLTALFVFMRLTRHYLAALVCSLLYTFLPFRFLRGIPHLFYSCYYVIPIAFLLVFWIAAGDFSLVPNMRSRRWRNRGGAGIVICVLVAASGIYYAFFSAFFVLLAGIYASVKQRSWKAVGSAAMCCGVMLFVVFLAVSPTLVYAYLHGPNPQVAQRPIADADAYGLRITQLLLPVSGHRIPYFARLKAVYNEHGTGAPVNENDTDSLGVVGAVGFLVLIGGLCAATVPDRPLWQRLWPLSMLNVWAVLLGTIGGFGCLFALTVTAGIRAYNRISPYIAFLCFSALIVIIDHLWQSWATSPARRNVFQGGLIILLAVGLFDQTTAAFVPDYAGTKGAFLNDRDFVAQIEGSMPQGAMVFQLPYHPWPEAGSENRMQDYDLLRPYLHSSHLRWSYGGMRGRNGDTWNRHVAGQPVAQMLQDLSCGGFQGLYVDRLGYSDSGARIERELRTALGNTSLQSANGESLFLAWPIIVSRSRRAAAVAGSASRQLRMPIPARRSG